MAVLWVWGLNGFPRTRKTHVPTSKTPPALAASAGGRADSETRILRPLSPHLRELIARAGNDEPLFPPDPTPEPEPDPPPQTPP